MADVVAYNPDVGLMSVRVGNAVYVLDKEDLAMTGAVLMRVLLTVGELIQISCQPCSAAMFDQLSSQRC
jgi:hypothetical protein